MTFLLPCPNCGPREVEEFRCSGEILTRPKSAPTPRELNSYLYLRKNVSGVHREWWYHRHGCGLWFVAERDTRDGRVVKTEVPGAAS